MCSVLPGGEQPIPLWNEHDTSTDADKPKILLYSLSLRFKVSDVQFVSALGEALCCFEGMKPVFSVEILLLSSCSQGIQMTATTPSMRAVRFETGLIELELSNRIQCKAQAGGSSSYLKLFGKCQVDLNLALGQIVKHQVQMKSCTYS